MSNSTKASVRNWMLAVCAIVFFIVQYACTTKPATQKQEAAYPEAAASIANQQNQRPDPQKQEKAAPEVLAPTEKGEKKPDPEVLALAEKGREALKSGKLDDSLRLLNEAYARARRLKDSNGEITTLTILAELFGRVGDTQQMLKCLNQALAICEAHEEKFLEAGILVNLGAAYRQIGQSGKALEHYERALELWKTLDIHPDARAAGIAVTQGFIDEVKREKK